MSGKTQRDDMPGDIIKLVHEHLGSPVDYTNFIEALVMYILRRDHLVHDAGIKVGKKLGHDHPEIKTAVKLMQAAIDEGGLSELLEDRLKDYVENV